MNAENLPLRASGIAWALWFAYWTIAAHGAAESRWKESVLGRAQHLAPACVAFYLIFGAPRWFGGRVLPEILGWPAFAVVAAGLSFAIWARVHLGRNWSGTITLKVGHRLIRTGPYSKIRHPIYTGFISAALGAGVSQGGWSGLIGFALIAIAFGIKLRREERILREQFGEEYEDYLRESWALFPGVW